MTAIFLLKTATNSRTSLDRKSTRLNSSHTVIYTLSLHDALPISPLSIVSFEFFPAMNFTGYYDSNIFAQNGNEQSDFVRSEEHTSELQSHSDLHSFPTRRSSDLTT